MLHGDTPEIHHNFAVWAVTGVSEGAGVQESRDQCRQMVRRPRLAFPDNQDVPAFLRESCARLVVAFDVSGQLRQPVPGFADGCFAPRRQSC